MVDVNKPTKKFTLRKKKEVRADMLRIIKSGFEPCESTCEFLEWLNYEIAKSEEKSARSG